MCLNRFLIRFLMAHNKAARNAGPPSAEAPPSPGGMTRKQALHLGTVYPAGGRTANAVFRRSRIKVRRYEKPAVTGNEQHPISQRRYFYNTCLTNGVLSANVGPLYI